MLTTSVKKGNDMTSERTRTARGCLVLTGAVVLTVLTGCQGNLKNENAALRAQNNELQAELDRARAALDLAEAARGDVVIQDTRSGFEGIEGVDVIQGAGTITVRVPGDVLFAPGKVDLRSGAKQTLQEISSVINREYPAQVIRVEGHTDTDPIKKSGWKDNLQLSSERSQAVFRFLREQGVSNEMYAAGFGEQRPRDSKEQSRRVEIVVVMQE